jgi:N-methylhydantoinase A/oxoprolinase/acetone carboxylase beta subunit
MRIGVDTGGTFTDFVFWDGKRVRTLKAPSTPADPSKAILAGLQAAQEVVHGSTVATNALLERKGARLAFVTTAGFEDLLEIGRQNRPSLYDWSATRPEPLAPRGLRFGLVERMLASGKVERPLTLEAADRLAREVKAADVESVAVCLLHSYANPAHERLVGERLRAAGLDVSLSSEILPEYREYERASTTAVNAYVAPLMRRYLGELERQACSRVRVFQSSGGVISASVAGVQAVHTVLSGPAGGLVGAVQAAKAAGFERVISFDMGGTSTDVALYDGSLPYTNETELGGCAIRISMLDIHSVGAGGGSIAYLDAGGALRVGPRSAGAVPGPVCYGVGEEITVTDANAVLGRIDPERFLGGAMRLDVERAHSHMSALAAQAGSSVEELARAIVDVANSNMERAIRRISVERGRDPREFALVSFGGAGGQHACELADRLEMRTVIVPAHAGVLSALGMLGAAVSREFSASARGREPERVFADLERRALEEMAEEGFENIVLERHCDLRYTGQSYELRLPWRDRESFEEHHRRSYGYAHQGQAVELVTVRVVASAGTADESLWLAGSAEGNPDYLSVYLPPGWRAAPVGAGGQVLRRA